MSNMPTHYESQRERWLKYGGNAVIVSVLAVLLGILLSWMGDKASARVDTTTRGLYSLKQQSLQVLRDLQTPVRIVCLYEEPEFGPEVKKEDRFDYRQPVYDLLDEYARRSPRVTVEKIDPRKQEARREQFVKEMLEKYSGEVQAYKGITDGFPEFNRQLNQMILDELKLFAAVAGDGDDAATRQVFEDVDGTLRTMLRELKGTQDALKDMLAKEIPEYKPAADRIRDQAKDLSDMLDQLVKAFDRLRDDTRIPATLRTYMAESPERYRKIKAFADDMIERIGKLGELKVEDLRRNLRARDAIIVMSDKEMRTIAFEQVWVVPQDIRGVTTEGKPRPRFAGEQQITSAILSLQGQRKPRVVFVRSGGQSLIAPGFPPFQRGGPYSLVAQRLKDFNFEVQEKDFGRSPMGPPTDEPTEEQLKEAVWIVPGLPSRMGAMGGELGTKVKEHLEAGGSAMILGYPGSPTAPAEDFHEALDAWGLKLRNDLVVVHEPLKAPQGPRNIIERVEREPMYFIVKDYGNHLISRDLNGLEGLFFPIVPVQGEGAPGVTLARLVPLPSLPTIWGESEVDNVMEDKAIAYEEPKAGAKGDARGPFFAGAAAEKGTSRLVVIGAAQMPMDGLLVFPDEDLLRDKNIYVARFPANGDLFMNSVFWLARQDTLISISSNALEINRVANMGSAGRVLWRGLVPLVVLPGLVIAAGVWTFFNRMD